MQNRLLELADVLGHPADRFEQLRIGRGMGLGQFRRRHAERVGRKLGLVDPGGIVEHGRHALFLHVAANPLDDLLGRKRLAKNLDRPPPAGFADDVSLRAEPRAQLGHRRADIFPPAIDATDVQVGWHSWAAFPETDGTSIVFSGRR